MEDTSLSLARIGQGIQTPDEVKDEVRHKFTKEGKRWETIAHETGLSYNAVRAITKGLKRGLPQAA